MCDENYLQKKIGSDSDDFELEDDFKMKVEPRSRVGRTKKPTKYNFGAESGEDEDEEEDNMDDADVSYHASPAQVCGHRDNYIPLTQCLTFY